MTHPSLVVLGSDLITSTQKSDLASFGVFSSTSKTHAKNIELKGFLNEGKLFPFLFDPERT